jgi:hypothetical protein
MNRSVESILVKNLEKDEALNRVRHAISLLPKVSAEIIQLKFDNKKVIMKFLKSLG